MCPPVRQVGEGQGAARAAAPVGSLLPVPTRWGSSGAGPPEAWRSCVLSPPASLVHSPPTARAALPGTGWRLIVESFFVSTMGQLINSF